MSETFPVTPSSSGSSDPESSRLILTTRIFPFSRGKVFQAFAEPEHLAQWWGPEGFTNTFHEFDFRAGGWWRFVMHGPDGTDYPNESMFVEITVPEKLMLEHHGGHWFMATFLFEEASASGGGPGSATRLTFRHLFSTAAHCAAIREFVTAANEQNFDRLGAELARMS